MPVRRKHLAQDPGWCHLCGLPIPDSIVSDKHPLFGTIDHVVPLSLGGKDVVENRAPAHRMCNQKKANKLALDTKEVLALQGRQRAALNKLGIKFSKNRLATIRLGMGLPLKPKLIIRMDQKSVMRWEDDGGLVGFVEKLVERDFSGKGASKIVMKAITTDRDVPVSNLTVNAETS